MASKRGMSLRNDAADARIDAVVDQIAALGAFEVRDRPAYRRDAALEQTERLERIADLLEDTLATLNTVVAERDAAVSERQDEDEDESPDPTLDRESFKALKFDDLKALATEAGAEGVEKMRSRDEVIDALEAQVDFSEFTGAGIEIDDDGVVRAVDVDTEQEEGA